VSDLVLRPERPDDAAAVADVLRRSFAEEPVVADLVDALRDSDAWVDCAFVAEADGAVVGYVALTRGLLDAPARLVDVLVLSPLGVVPEHQGRGTGSALVRHALDAVVDGRPEPLVFLEGSPRYYPRFGFVPGGDLGFRKPSLRIPDAAFQVVRLPSYEDWMTGTLVYPEPFWRLDCVGLRDAPA
jgi:putative acetyltransferase